MTERVAEIEICRMAVEEIRGHPRNPRKHPEPGSKLWEILKRSLERSYFEPLVWNRRNGFLVSGHLRLKVLTEMGYTHVDVTVVDLSEVEHYALMIAANRTLGEWEESVLASLAADIDEAGLDAALALYDHKSLLALVDCPVTEDDTEEVEQMLSKAELLQLKWKVQPGELFQIGGHRLLCGNCESLDNWQRLLGDEQADMLWCDPPYNVAYDREEKKRLKAGRERSNDAATDTILNDDVPRAKYLELLHAWFSTAASRLKSGGAFYVAHADSYGLEVRQALRNQGLNVSQCLIWVKQAWTLTRQDYQWQHEPILYGWKPGAGHHWQGGFSQSTVIDDCGDLKKLSKGELITMVNHLRNAVDTTIVREPRNVVSDLHPTIKPTRLVARHIWNSTHREERVMELFSGSGTTMAAAEQTGRRCFATELDPKYVAVGLERMCTLGLTIEKLHGPR